MSSNRRRTYRSGVILLLLISVVFLTGCTASQIEGDTESEKITFKYAGHAHSYDPDDDQSNSIELRKETSGWVKTSSGEKVSRDKIAEFKRILTNRSAGEDFSEYKDAIKKISEERIRLREKMENISRLLDKRGENMSNEEKREYEKRLAEMERRYFYRNVSSNVNISIDVNTSRLQFEPRSMHDHFYNDCRISFVHNSTHYDISSARNECGHDAWKVEAYEEGYANERSYVIISERVTEIFSNVTGAPMHG